MLLPEYGVRSLAEVLPAALRVLDVPTAPADPGALALDPARGVVLLLVDGLGTHLLRSHAGDAPFLSGLRDAGPLTVGFPSSTPVSLTSLGTGLPPGAHGMLGVSFRAPGGALLDSLTWTSVGDPEPRDMLGAEPPERVQPRPTVFQRAEAAGVAVTVVSKREFAGSGLTRAALRGGRFRGALALGDLAAEMLGAVAGPGRALCYGYTADLDALGHLHGPGSPAWRMQLRQIDRLTADIAEGLPPGTTLLVTGDHGMVDATVRFDADTDPDLQRGVALLGGDPRARHVHVRDGARDDVLSAWRSVLGEAKAGGIDTEAKAGGIDTEAKAGGIDTEAKAGGIDTEAKAGGIDTEAKAGGIGTEHAWIVTGEQAVADGWFGPVPAAMRGRVGDVVVAMRGAAAVVRSEAEPVIARMPGQHGSLTPQEQLVPLLVHTS